MRRLAGAAGLARAARDRRPDLAAAEAMGGGGGAAGSRKRGGEYFLTRTGWGNWSASAAFRRAWLTWLLPNLL
jgi:hypothetical protein